MKSGAFAIWGDRLISMDFLRVQDIDTVFFSARLEGKSLNGWNSPLLFYHFASIVAVRTAPIRVALNAVLHTELLLRILLSFLLDLLSVIRFYC